MISAAGPELLLKSKDTYRKILLLKTLRKFFPEFYIVLLKLNSKMYCLTLHDKLTVQVSIFIIII